MTDTIDKTDKKEPPDVLEIRSAERMRVIQLGRCHFKLIGCGIQIVDFMPGEMLEDPSTKSPADADPRRLITRNRGIVMQGENACTLPDIQWLIVHRLNCSDDYCMSLDDACSNEKGEKIWDDGKAPAPSDIRSYLSRAKTKLHEWNIFVSLSYSESNGLFTMTVE